MCCFLLSWLRCFTTAAAHPVSVNDLRNKKLISLHFMLIGHKTKITLNLDNLQPRPADQRRGCAIHFQTVNKTTVIKYTHYPRRITTTRKSISSGTTRTFHDWMKRRNFHRWLLLLRQQIRMLEKQKGLLGITRHWYSLLCWDRPINLTCTLFYFLVAVLVKSAAHFPKQSSP